MTRERWLGVHRWIGIVIVLQVIASFSSALIFAVRSVLYQLHPPAPSAAPLPAAYDLSEAISKSLVRQPASANLWNGGAHPFYVVAGKAETVLLDGLTGRRLNPKDPDGIRDILRMTGSYQDEDLQVIERVESYGPSYSSGELPVWRVRRPTGVHLYVSMTSGRILSSEDRLARVSHYAYDYLHTMKYTDSKLLNAAMPIPYILAGLSLALLGIYLFFTRNLKT